MTRWYQFHARKALFEVPKSAIYIFGLKMTVLVQLPVSQRQNSTLCGFVLFSRTFVFQCFFFLLIRWSQETHLNVNLRHHMYWWWCYYWWFWCWWRWCWWTESWHQGMKNSFDAQRAKLSGSSPAWIIDSDESDGNDGVGGEYWIEWYCNRKNSDDTHYDIHVQQWWLWYWWI